MESIRHRYMPVTAEGCPAVIAGPCSAETRQQVIDTAEALAAIGVTVFRAGLWKPRTMPGCFEGVGTAGLPWLAEVRHRTGMLTATEVATAEHVRAAVAGGVDILWIGARTTANPFAVQEVADTLAEIAPDTPLLVKNPVSPDIELWIGAIERCYRAGLRRLAAVHRGFTAYGASIYRNAPQWHIPLELRRLVPGLPVIHDPSHVGGRREMVAPLASRAMAIGFDGLIIESHCDPDNALSDAAQQVTPTRLADILASLDIRERRDAPDASLTALRSRLDDIDAQIIDLLARRMEVCDEVGIFKRRNRLTVVQPDRYDALIRSRVAQGTAQGLQPAFVTEVMKLIHAESVSRQSSDNIETKTT